MTTINKALLLAILGLIYGALVIVFPDFPVDKEVFIALVLYVLAKLGVEWVEYRFRAFFAKRGMLK